MNKSYESNFSLLFTAEIEIEADSEEEAILALTESDWESNYSTYKFWATPDIHEV